MLARNNDEFSGGWKALRHTVVYTPSERLWLAMLGAFGFLAVNGAFVYGLLIQPDAMMAALTNPLAAAFIVEALVLVGVFAYLFERWGVSRLGWGWFVFLSLLGSMAFAIPIMLLYPRRDKTRGGIAPDTEPGIAADGGYDVLPGSLSPSGSGI